MPLRHATRLSHLLARAGVWHILLVGFTLALTWIFMVSDLRDEYSHAIDGAQRETSALARGLGETTLASFDTIDQTLKDMREAYARDPAHFDLRAWFAEHRFGTGLIIQASVVGPDGIVVQSNLPLAVRTDLSDREHVRFQKNSTGDEMFISKPVIGRVSNRKSLNVTRKMVNPDGSYAGTVVVSAGLDYLTRFYESLSARGVIALIGRNDGIIRSRAPVDNDLIGTPEPDIGRMVAGSANGTLRTDTAHGAVDRIASYRVLQKYPLVVEVALDASEVFEQYNHDLRRYLVAGGILTVLFLVVGTLLVRQRRSLLAGSAALTATLENISQGILMVDAAGNVPVINRRAIELLALPASLMERRPSFREILAYQLATNEFGRGEDVNPEFIQFVASGGLSSDVPFYERVRADGTALEIRTQELADGGAVRTYTNVTERKRNEVTLAAARDAAEAGARARAEFIAVMSHEIRTPLNGILGVAELLQGLELSPVAIEYANVISASGTHLLQIINDILDFSSLDAARLDLEEGVFDIRDVVRQATTMLGHQAKQKGLDLTLEIADEVPARVFGDAQRLRQIVLNLAGNGVKFTLQGSVHVAVRKLRDEPDGVRLGFSIADTGIGISAEAQGRLFNEFTQGDSSIRRRFGGSGLGLAITRRLVELMDGHVSVESMPGAGSTFRFDLRLRNPPPDAAPAPQTPERLAAKPAIAPPVPVPVPAPAPVPAAAPVPVPVTVAAPVAPVPAAAPALPETAAQPPGLRILLAEDNATNRFVATRMLERLGHDVQSVVDGQAAVEAVKADDHDLVLMDMMMPEMDGLTATRVIRAMDGPKSRIPIIGLTANAMEADAEACREAGMDGFVTKPVKAARLEEAMREVLNERVGG
jgi:signal transduction histidine kinase/ActR/RegA family two-component response regulator